jgi:hypothetical protein
MMEKFDDQRRRNCHQPEGQYYDERAKNVCELPNIIIGIFYSILTYGFNGLLR